jgi:hypothetical protein
VKLSPHFDSREFACRHCGVELWTDHLVEHLERLRGIIGEPLLIVSAYRCAVHNARIGGAGGSMHLTGEAVDLRRGYARVSQASHAGFTGIGASLGWATHVDVREKPARWVYR